MAEITPVAANVKLKDKGGAVTLVQYGETVTQGQIVYRKDDGKYWLAVNTDATKSEASKIVLTPGAAGDWGMVAGNGVQIDFGATLTKSEVYVLSSTNGNMELVSDLASGEYLTQIGYASATDTLVLNFNATGVTHP